MAKHTVLTGLVALTLGATAVFAANPQEKPVMPLRGTVTQVNGDQLQLTDRRGEKLTAELTADTKVAAVSQGNINDIKPNSFIGTAASPQPDGSLKALEVHVFDPSLRGSGEGFRLWQGADGKTGTMTNGTLVNANGRTMTVKYQNGEKKVVVPEDVPVVALAPVDRSLIKPGVHIVLFPAAQSDANHLVAGNIVAGVNGIVPPM
ncbi:hypothetical protein JZM24_13150 [Candidatus Sodalis endolongispinus]|uniref:DUF5666 domain-containing protein n=1 Tax=Candidatus Sodalis endolongispinus TaxID=2812662 RepID=A0ABS5YD13_9GAMM|nr:hypothetical protein [Candidatus Sodalis endolongispinus]MBT9432838.1 hypothetical protein [Candidatus Sodalis endolongispinus]